MDKLSIENVVRFSPIGEMTWSKRRRQTQLSTCQIKIKFQMDIYLSAGTKIPKGNSSERNENKLSKKEWKPTKPRQWDRTNFCNISVRVLNRMMMISFFKANLRHNSQNFKENDRRRPTIVVPPLFPENFFCWPSLFIRVSVCVQRYHIFRPYFPLPIFAPPEGHLAAIAGRKLSAFSSHCFGCYCWQGAGKYIFHKSTSKCLMMR